MATKDSPFDACTRFLSGHGPRRAHAQLQAAIALVDETTKSDFYGGGELIESFEEEMAALLGQPAAVFMPSGTMAQQIALRVWSDAAESKRFAMHPTSHLQLHEQGAYRELHALDAQLLGEADRLFHMGDLEALAPTPAAILWELPQREIGGQLPELAALQEQLAWAKAAGIRRHLDGARLWEAAPHYGLALDEIAGLFDSVYVSFYKGIGGIAGAILAGPSEFVVESKRWLRRHGGNLIALHPYILSARAGLQLHQHRFAEYRLRAQAIARRVGAIEGITVVPALPCTNMMHFHIAVEAEALNIANAKLAEQSKVMLFGKASARGEKLSKVEISIGAACEALSDDEIETLFRQLLAE